MPTPLDNIKNACAYIDAGGARGTGYLVSPDTLVTCEHVIRQVPDGQKVELHFGDTRCEAKVITRDDQADCAILQLTTPLNGIEPLNLTAHACRRGDTWDAYGFPSITKLSGHFLSGDVQDPTGKDPSNNDAVVLYSREIAAGEGAPPQGFSGTPILVGGYVVGHLKRIIPNTADGNSPARAMMGTLYACPSRLVANLLPQSARKVVRKPQSPATGYDPAWYVSRAGEEALALNHLASPGAPVVLWGPFRSGKTTTLNYLLECVRRDENNPSTIVMVNLGLFDWETKQSLDTLLKEMSTVIAQELNIDPIIVEQVWKGPGSPPNKTTRLMEMYFLPKVKGRMVLAIDRADEVWRQHFRSDFFRVLRAWADDANNEVWSPLRLILTVSSSPLFLIDDPNGSPFNLTNPIELNDLDDTQMSELAERYGLNWSSTDRANVRAVVGGQPYLLRVLMYQAGTTATSVNQLLTIRNLTSVYAIYFDQYRAWLNKNQGLAAELNRFINGQVLPAVNPVACHKLVRAGLLIKEEGGDYRLSYGLYKHLFG